MANARDIRRRIKSVKNTAKITKAMQLVASSKMKKAQDAAISGRPYAQLLAEIIDNVTKKIDHEKFTHPFLEEREVKHRGILLISSDKGLCGPLLSNLFRLVTDIEKSARFITIGRKGMQFVSRTNRQLIADFHVSDKARFIELRPIVEMMIECYMNGEIDTIEVVYSRFINTLTQLPTIIKMAPFDDLSDVISSFEGIEDYTTDAPISNDSRPMVFEQPLEELLDELLVLSIKREIHQLVYEAKASEHSARMVAMKSATDNANNLVDELTLKYNKARQAAITQEILEITAAQMAETV